MRPHLCCFLAALLATVSLMGPLHAEQSFREQGAAAYRLGDYKKAVEFYEQSLATALKLLKEDDMALIERRAELGEAYRAAGQWADAISQLDYVWRRCRMDAEKKKHWDSTEGTMAMDNADRLGKACMGAGRYEDSIMVFKTAAADAERGSLILSGMQFTALLAEAQFLANHPDDAAVTVKRAAEIAQKVSIDPGLEAKVLSQLGGLCLRQRRAEVAKPLVERALALGLKVFPEGGITLGEYQEQMAQVLLVTGDLNGAAEHLQAARESILKKVTNSSPQLVGVLLDESNLALRRGQGQEALSRAQQALSLARKNFSEEDPHIGASLAQVARSYLALNEPEKAQVVFTQALTLLNRTLGEDDPQTREVREEAVKLGPRLTPAKSSAARDPKK